MCIVTIIDFALMSSLAKAIGRLGLVPTFNSRPSARKRPKAADKKAQQFVPTMESRVFPIELPPGKVIDNTSMSKISEGSFEPIEVIGGRVRFIANIHSAIHLTGLTLDAYKQWQRNPKNDRLFEIARSAFRSRVCDFVQGEAKTLGRRIDSSKQLVANARSLIPKGIDANVELDDISHAIMSIEGYEAEKNMGAACQQFWSRIAAIVGNKKQNSQQPDATQELDGYFIAIRLGLRLLRLLDELVQPGAAEFLASLAIAKALEKGIVPSNNQWTDIHRLSAAGLPVARGLGIWEADTIETFEAEEKLPQMEDELLQEIYVKLVDSGKKMDKKLARLMKSAAKTSYRIQSLKFVTEILRIYRQKVIIDEEAGKKEVSSYISSLPKSFPKDDVVQIVDMLDAILKDDRKRAGDAMEALSKKLYDEKKVLGDQIVAFKERIDEYEADIRKLEAEGSSKLKDASKKISDLERELAEAVIRQKKDVETFDKLKDEYTASIQRIEQGASAQSEMVKLLEELDESKKTATDLEEKVQKLEAEKAAIATELEEVTVAVEEAVGKVEQLEQSSSDKSALEQELAQAREQHQNLENQLAQLRADYSALEAELADANNSLSSTELGKDQEIQELTEKLSQATKKAQYHELNEELQAGLVKIRDDTIQSMVENAKSVAAKKAIEIQTLQKQIDAFRKVHGEDSDRIDELTEEVERLNESIDAKVKTITDLEKELDGELDRYERLQNKFGDVVKRITELAPEIQFDVTSDADTTLNNFFAALATIPVKLAASARVPELENEVLSLSTKNADLVDARTGNEATIQALQAKLVDAERSIEESARSIQELTDNKTKLLAEISNRDDTIRTLEQSAGTKVQSSGTSEQVQQLTQEKDQLVAQLSSLQQKLTAETSRAESFAVTIESLRGQLTTKTVRVNELTKEAKTLSEQNKDLTRLSTVKDRTIAKLQKSIKPFMDTIQSAANAINEQLLTRYDLQISDDYLDVDAIEGKDVGQDFATLEELKVFVFSQSKSFCETLVMGLVDIAGLLVPLLPLAADKQKPTLDATAQKQILSLLSDWGVFNKLLANVSFVLKYMCAQQKIGLRFTFNEQVIGLLSTMFLAIEVEFLAQQTIEGSDLGLNLLGVYACEILFQCTLIMRGLDKNERTFLDALSKKGITNPKASRVSVMKASYMIDLCIAQLEGDPVASSTLYNGAVIVKSDMRVPKDYLVDIMVAIQDEQ